MHELHFSQIIEAQAKKYGNKPLFHFRKNLTDEWTNISWTEFSTKTNILGLALIELGIEEKECVGQFSQNMTENLIVDFALYSNRAIMVPLYATSSVSQVEYIVNDAGIKVLFVGEQQQYDVALEVLSTSKTLQKIIVLDSEVKLKDDGHSMYFTDLIELGKSQTIQLFIKQGRKTLHLTI